MAFFKRKSNGQFNGSESRFRFSFLERLTFCLVVALYISLATLIVGVWVKDSTQLVKEVWASFDKEVYVQTIVKTKPEEPSAVLKRIAQCESKSKHYLDNGTLNININRHKDGTLSVDIGKWQLNEFYWEKQARALGYDIYLPEGNEKMAMWIYENKGTQEWSATEKCWRR
jgi:hypothetical protein